MSALEKWAKRLVEAAVWGFFAYCTLLALFGLYAAFYCGIPGFFGRLAEGCAP